MHPGDLRVGLQTLGDFQGRGVVPLYPQVKGLEAAQHEPGGVGVHGAAEDVVHGTHGIHGLLLAGNAAGEDVIVAGQVLGGGVEDEVGAKVKHPLVNGGGKGAVNAHEGTLLVAHLADGGDVHAPQVGVCGRLGEVEGHFVFVQGPLEGFQVRGVDDGGRDAHLREHRLDELPGAAVAVRGGDNVATGRDQGEQHCGGGVHARGGQQAVLSSLQRHDLRLTGAGGRVAIPAILVGSIIALLIVDELLRVAEGVCGGLNDGGRQGIADPRPTLALAAVHGEGAGRHAAMSVHLGAERLLLGAGRVDAALAPAGYGGDVGRHGPPPRRGPGRPTGAGPQPVCGGPATPHNAGACNAAHPA
mmetsp:Transcript_29096/g.82008  ORF Transcript_29096/g.82008 Transcript_29096/m.82008 type:complete len:358 (+) Transcript_29096:482-1555(+)